MINRSDYNSLPAKARYSMIIGNLLSLAIPCHPNISLEDPPYLPDTKTGIFLV